MRYEFNGMVTDTEKCIDVNEEFDIVYDVDDEVFYSSKETFHHDEEGLEFDYKYIIKLTNMAMITGEEQPLIVELSLVVAPDCLSEKALNNVSESFSWEDGLSENWKYKDIADYSYSINMGSADVPDIEGIPYTENKDLMHTLNSITAVYKAVDSMRGFYLDRPVNRLGTTGWDTINECVKGTDAIRETLNRYNNK